MSSVKTSVVICIWIAFFLTEILSYMAFLNGHNDGTKALQIWFMVFVGMVLIWVTAILLHEKY